MPIVRFVCPHCEKPAEVQVTGVTRSRACPHCGDSVLLQVAFIAKDTGLSKRQALLVNSVSDAPAPGSTAAPKLGSLVPVAVQVGHVEEAPTAAAEDLAPEPEKVSAPVKRQLPVMRGPAYEPKVLDGSVVERMRMDPEVRHLKVRLALGVAAVVAALTFVFAGLIYDEAKPQDLSREAAEQMLGGANLKKQPKSKNTMVLMRGSGEDASASEGKDTLELQSGEKALPRKPAEGPSTVLPTSGIKALTGG